jgi:hypothetical protein
MIAVIVTLAAIIGGIGSAAQGFAAYNDWACKLQWAAFCPVEKKK